MRAVQYTEFGGPEVLRYVEVERPVPRDGEVLIQVKAIGVNYSDVSRRRGSSVASVSLPFIPGSEVSGIVAEIGTGVEDLQPGDHVAALLGRRGSGYAEYAVASAGRAIHVPENMSYDEAAAVPLQGLTAYHVLQTSGKLCSQESVLVHAAAGGVGTLAVQMAKFMEAGNVIATAGNRKKLELARELGADELINYTTADWPERVLAATGGRGADVILEAVGGENIRKNLECLAPFGRMVVFGAASGERGTLSPSSLMRNCQTITGFFLTGLLDHPESHRLGLKRILDWIAAGKLRLVITGRFPLEHAAEAQSLLESRSTTGKLILNP